jgi:hypothetical protein
LDTATIHHEARLLPFTDGAEHAAVQPGSWFITHPLGKPAGNTYTEVIITPAVQAEEHPEHVIDAVVRRVADELYGRAWAFHYRPEQYADSIERWGMTRRERVAVTSVEVWT